MAQSKSDYIGNGTYIVFNESSYRLLHFKEVVNPNLVGSTQTMDLLDLPLDVMANLILFVKRTLPPMAMLQNHQSLDPE